ncbi:MAG: hypothetical protein RLZZ56_1079 [Actinomycetota bacterium]|jgi:hypothetical protein
MIYRERVLPSAPNLLLPILLFVSVIAIVLPISEAWAIPVAALLSAAFVAFLFVSSPVIEISETELVCKGARIERKFLGEIEIIPKNENFEQLGQKLDARAWLAIQPSVKGLLKIQIVDETDPTPYWLLTSRNVARINEILEKA